MTIPFLTPARTVLLIGDEALYIHKVTHNAVKMIDSVPWQTDDFEGTVVGLIRKECGGLPVLILNDMTDQHFKGGQRLPKVSVMDKGNVLKRKLQVAFPNYPIRGALPIKVKDKKPSGEGVRQVGGLYLFAAVPASEPIVKTLEAVKLSLAPIAGFVLLPIESSDMVKGMAEKLSGKSREPARWVIFMGQHQNGALRQVITRDGQLAMTRMTPISDASADPQTWAHEVSQEFKATISYLSRFGYSPEDGTDVIVIANERAGEMVGKLIETPCNFNCYTAPEAARLLGASIGLQDDSSFADPLHVAWAGRKSKFILPMEAAELDKIHKPRQAVAAVMFLLCVGAAYLSWQLISEAQAMIVAGDELGNQKNVLAGVDAEYQQEVARMEGLGFDIKLIQGTIATYQNFQTDSMPVMPILAKIGEGLGNDLRLDRLSVTKLDAETVTDPTGVQKPGKARLEAVLSLSFPPTVEMELGIKEINNLEKRLRDVLPDYDVAITQQVGRPEYTAQLKGEVGTKTNAEGAAKDYTAELKIRGPKQ